MLLLSPKCSKTQIDHFSSKSVHLSKKAAAKFLCVKTYSSEVVRHSLAYLAMHKWLVGHVPFYVKFWTKVTHPLQKWRFTIYTVSQTREHCICGNNSVIS